VPKYNRDDIKFIYNLLRKGTSVWSGRKEILDQSRKKVLEKRTKKGKPIYKYHWQCASCKNWFRDVNSLEVDHIVEVGGVTSFNGDWNEMINKIFPRPVEEHFQVLCIPCHMKKTNEFNSARTRWNRK
jgi:5-methylcytosine-specific restriction endonuclease McrA